MKDTISILILIFLSSCAGGIQHLPEKNINLAPTSICDLPKVQGELVYTRGTLSGVDEYWSFSEIGKRCKDTLNIELDLDANWEKWKNEDKEKINFVYSEYWNKYLIIDAIGIFEMGGNYGHLGTNNAKFIVHELVSVKLIEKKR